MLYCNKYCGVYDLERYRCLHKKIWPSINLIYDDSNLNILNEVIHYFERYEPGCEGGIGSYGAQEAEVSPSGKAGDMIKALIHQFAVVIAYHSLYLSKKLCAY